MEEEEGGGVAVLHRIASSRGIPTDKGTDRHANCLICEQPYHLFVCFFVTDDSVYLFVRFYRSASAGDRGKVPDIDHGHFLFTKQCNHRIVPVKYYLSS